MNCFHPVCLLTLLLFLTAGNLEAQEIAAEEDGVIQIGQPFAKKAGGVVVLNGIVTNPETGELLEGASVIVEGSEVGTTTKASGQYFLLLPIGEFTIKVRYLGLETIQKKIRIYHDGVLDFGLGAQAYSLLEVVVDATMDENNVVQTNAGLAQLKTKEIRALPTFLGEVDIVQSLLLLPGVSTVGEGSSGFNVRGGRIDQNLVLLNDAPLFNTSHLLGFFSAFNPDVVDRFSLYKGNMPAQFGGRVASVLDIDMKNGDFEDFHLTGGLGIVSSRLVAEGPIIKDKTSFLLGGRISYSDWLLKVVREPAIRQSSASFYDANAVLGHRFNNNHRLELAYYGSHDLFRYSRDFGYEYGTQLGSLKWNGIFNDRLSTSSLFVYGDYTSESFDPEGLDGFRLNNGIKYYQFKQNFFYLPDKHTINFGLEMDWQEMKPDDLQKEGVKSAVPENRVEKTKGRTLSAYVNDDINLTDKLSLSIGLRYSLYQQLGSYDLFLYGEEGSLNRFNIIDTISFGKGEVVETFHGLEPRIGFRLGLGENNSIKGSYNRVRQYIHLISNSVTATPVDLWQLSTPYILPEIADNFSLGYYQNFSDNLWETSVEVYYKSIQNLIDYKDFATLLLNEHIETDLLAGKGKAYGAELYIRKKAGNLSGWISYTYSRSLIQVQGDFPEDIVNEGEWYPTHYDQPHALTLLTKMRMGRASSLTFNFTYRTGRPITGLLSNYELFSTAVPHFSDRNAYRIPDYYRLDVSLFITLRTKPDKKLKSSLVFSIYNLLGRRNAFSVFFQQQGRVVVPRPFRLAVLGSAFPAITYNFSF